MVAHVEDGAAELGVWIEDVELGAESGNQVAV